MNNLPSRQKLFLYTGIGFLLLLIIVSFFIGSTTDDFEQEITLETNPVTGETIRSTNATPETAGTISSFVIYGYRDLDESLSHVQREIFREQTRIFLAKSYDQVIDSISIIPGSVESVFPNDREENITLSAVVDGTDDTIDVFIRPLGLTGVEISYTSSNNQVASFETGPITQTVDVDYSGDGIPPEDRD